MRGVAEKFLRHQLILNVGAGDSINGWIRLQHLKLPAKRLNLRLARIIPSSISSPTTGEIQTS